MANLAVVFDEIRLSKQKNQETVILTQRSRNIQIFLFLTPCRKPIQIDMYPTMNVFF